MINQKTPWSNFGVVLALGYGFRPTRRSEFKDFSSVLV